ncbi:MULTISPECIES: helix-turn-helix transcriptional regulator [Citrobacter]|uniref:helix-turn-helix domain-containing protein n=1 Tax=Citrobacter TaxID=544 RepID=UPI001A3034C7|nr:MULTISPECIES: helix-turn-helix transcriptional regulator [Citrobacter]HAT2328196.1 helix-turn-helix transcriptional regulator [Citrobacter freundii]MCR3694209.1 helix-turn-helix transcriptional regulator [Citrobacter portucalensis]MDM2755653.1 helix-turn-helix transcriptional regulator [Citrobacter sp. Cpo221]MDM2901971.1 helix-turn-helix transcriptional regulator [Citrobacter sp. Cpo037]WFZ27706.1 helix-turn-helix transcriptional regulator [Citrobacter portucalensis]
MQSPLRILRKSQGMTLSYVAKGVDIDPGNLSRIERGQQIASLDIAERLVSFFSGKINELEILYPHRYSNCTGASTDIKPQDEGASRG